jgi:hypothetical protein
MNDGSRLHMNTHMMARALQHRLLKCTVQGRLSQLYAVNMTGDESSLLHVSVCLPPAGSRWCLL